MSCQSANAEAAGSTPNSVLTCLEWCAAPKAWALSALKHAQQGCTGQASKERVLKYACTLADE